MRIVGRIVEEHGSHEGLAVNGLVGYGICVRQQHRLQLEVVAVDGCSRLAQGLRILGVIPPAIHVELHGREGLPLEIADVDLQVLATEDTVHVRGDVSHARESRANIGGDVETNVLPLATGLVATPYACIALCAGPSVEGDDEGAGIVAIVGHDVCHVGNAVETKGVAIAHPGHIGLEHPHTGVAHLFDDVALQQGTDAVDGMEVRLGPEPNLHTVLTGIVAKALQVGDVAVEGRGLAIAGTITVVGQHPPQRHIGLEVAVYHGTGRKLVVVVLAIEAFLDAAIVFLTLGIILAIFKGNAILGLVGLFPEVAVVGIEVTFVEGKLRQQHRTARELVIVVEQFYRCGIYHHKKVEVCGLVREFHHALVGSAKVVGTGGEGVGHEGVATRRPIIRGRRGHTAIGPAVGVDDFYLLAFVREASVLHAATVEILIGLFLEGDGVAAALEVDGCVLRQYGLAAPQVGDTEEAIVTADVYTHGCRGHGKPQVAAAYLELAHRLAGVVNQDAGRRRGLWVADDAPLIVLEQTEDLLAIEVDSHRLSVLIKNLDGCRIEQPHVFDGVLSTRQNSC